MKVGNAEGPAVTGLSVVTGVIVGSITGWRLGFDGWNDVVNVGARVGGEDGIAIELHYVCKIYFK